MPSIKVIDNRSSLFRKLKELGENLEELHTQIIIKTAVSLASVSPVDTGAYMDSFNVTEGRSRAGGVSSKGKPRNQAKDAYMTKAISRMSAQARTTKAGLAVISNNAPHAGKRVADGDSEGNSFGGVEGKYHPFAITRARRATIIADAKAAAFSKGI